MRRYKFLGYALIAIGLYVFWSSIFLPLAADHTSLCGRCHATSRAYRNSYFSAHREIGCLACHRNPGIGGRLSADLRGLRNLSAGFGRSQPQEQFVDNDACLACHDEITDEVSKDRTVKMSHREVIDAGWRCGECHGNTGHKLGGIKGALQNPSMDKCFGCHLSQPRLRRCRACHIGSIPKGTPKNVAAMGSAAHVKDWKRSKHGQAEQDPCAVCHEGAFCKSCHKVSLPHSKANWPYQHSAAAKIDEQACHQCHRPQFCLDCHKVPMPHQNDYNRKHMTDPAGADTVCYNCHLKDQCEACHRAHKTHGVRK